MVNNTDIDRLWQGRVGEESEASTKETTLVGQLIVEIFLVVVEETRVANWWQTWGNLVMH